MPRRSEPDAAVEQFGLKIRELRLARGLTMNEQMVLGLNKGHLSSIENALSIPSVVTFCKIVRGLKLTRIETLGLLDLVLSEKEKDGT